MGVNRILRFIYFVHSGLFSSPLHFSVGFVHGVTFCHRENDFISLIDNLHEVIYKTK